MKDWSILGPSPLEMSDTGWLWKLETRPARKDNPPPPSEDREQRVLVAWLDRERPDIPYFAVPNGGWRSKATAGILKATGVKPGVPDLVFPAARGGHHGLFIELKRTKGGRASENQKAWLERLRAGGYRAEICAGAEAAMAVITGYFGKEAGP
jgi:rhodanese-related sulfurtransferase